MPRLSLMALAALVFLSLPSAAFEGEEGGRSPDRRGPPQVALDACDGAAELDTCSFEGRRGEALSGSCEVIQEQLACVPEGHREQERQREGR